MSDLKKEKYKKFINTIEIISFLSILVVFILITIFLIPKSETEKREFTIPFFIVIIPILLAYIIIMFIISRCLIKKFNLK